MNRTGMSRALFGAVAACLTAVALFAAGPARSLTINDQGACSAWTWNATNATLTCTPATGGPPPPASQGPSGCTLTSSPSSLGVAGGAVNLTVTCGGSAPTSYAWSASPGATFSGGHLDGHEHQ